MNLGRVIGNVWATRKNTALDGQRMLLVQPLSFSGSVHGRPIVALDTVDAGERDVVMYVTSREAAIPFDGLTPTDATIVGVVDTVDNGAMRWGAKS